jgi:cytochrome c oxidase subunit 1/cytochrome c oxidase subunit I+III
MNGRMLNERAGVISFWLMFVGFNLTFFPMHIAGLLGQPRRTYTYPPGLGWELYNLIETIGAFVLALGVLVTLINWYHALRRGSPAGNDPWGGETLEWATTSPPPEYNFEAIPTVRSLTPVWDQPDLRDGAQPRAAGGQTLAGGHLTMSTSMLDARPQAIVHMPHESAWPLILTTAMLLLSYGLLISNAVLTVVGAVGIPLGIAGWFWPRGETQES